MLSLLDAGLSLIESVETIADKTSHVEAKALLGDVLHKLYEGKTFSDALAHAPAVFPSLYVATVRAAEKTGDLSPALQRYLGYRQSIDSIRRTVINASIYPVLLIVIGGLVTFYLLGFVVPKFAAIYDDTGRDLPMLSRLMLDLGNAISEHGMTLFAALLAGMAGLVFVVTRPAISRALGDAMWKLPFVGERLRRYQLARFYRTTGMLLSGGMPIMTALAMAQGLLPTVLQSLVQKASESIRSGLSISRSMEDHGLTTPVAQRMLRVGERTGRMDEMMERIARFHDEELARWIDSFMRLFGPLLMIAIGLIIGMILILLYMPIFDLTGNLQ